MNFFIKLDGNEYFGESADEVVANIRRLNVKTIDEDFVRKLIRPIAERGNASGGRQKFPPPPSPENNGISFKEAVSGALALLKNAVGVSVAREEVERRAKICAGCPLVRDTSDCKACGAGREIASFLTSISRSIGFDVTSAPYSLKSRFCAACGCSLAIMLPSRMENFKKSKASRPSHCWANPESENFIP